MPTIDFLAAFEGYWLARRRDFSQNTINDYSVTFKRFAKHIGSQPVADITPSDLHAFLNAVQKRHRLKAKTMANIWAALSSFFTWAETELKIAHPIRGL